MWLLVRFLLLHVPGFVVRHPLADFLTAELFAWAVGGKWRRRFYAGYSKRTCQVSKFKNTIDLTISSDNFVFPRLKARVNINRDL